MTWMEWYQSLAKPAWTPTPSTISLIWMLLYPVIAVSFGFVFMQGYRGRIGWPTVLPFLINLVTNLMFMPIFSGLRNIPLATLDIVIVWGSLVWGMAAIWRHYRWVAIAQFPYFVWVSIAATVQLAIMAWNT